jgi:hypothetical protein
MLDAGPAGVLALAVTVGMTPRGSVETAPPTRFNIPAATAASSPAHTVKERKLFFMCRIYGFCERNHICGADH